jgi:hypothetical protein
MNQLIEKGVWKIREGELSPAKFEEIDDAQKMTYLYNILILEPDMRSTYERVILDRYNKGVYSFILDEKYAHIDEPVLIEDKITPTKDRVEYPTEQELVQFGKKYLEKYLNAILDVPNPRWKNELKFVNADNFITNTRNYLEINNLTVLHIKAYKKVMLND